MRPRKLGVINTDRRMVYLNTPYCRVCQWSGVETTNVQSARIELDGHLAGHTEEEVAAFWEKTRSVRMTHGSTA